VVVVAGPSMLPTLRPGDCLLVRRGGRVRPGDVVVVRFASRPDLLAVKRAMRPADPRDRSGGGGAWMVQGDNPAVADDSRRYGPAEVLARVVTRYWPPSGWGRLPRS
jgi:phage repressor protein C with HTH and peptisase S24 domain